MAVEKKEEKKIEVKDKELGVDYSYLINRTITPFVFSEEEIASEDTELLRTFLEQNNSVQPYIDKAIFDPEAICAKHILNKLKDKDFKVKIGEKEYRLAEAIMLKVMGACYTYVQNVAQAIAQARGNKNCIQLSDDDVFQIAENYFKLGGMNATITISDVRPSAKKKADKKSEPKTTTTVTPISEDKKDDLDLPEEIDTDVEETVVENKPTQISFFDL